MTALRPSEEATRPQHLSVDASPDGWVILTHVAQDDLESEVIYMTPVQAAKLGQWLLDVAYRLETP